MCKDFILKNLDLQLNETLISSNYGDNDAVWAGCGPELIWQLAWQQGAVCTCISGDWKPAKLLFCCASSVVRCSDEMCSSMRPSVGCLFLCSPQQGCRITVTWLAWDLQIHTWGWRLSCCTAVTCLGFTCCLGMLVWFNRTGTFVAHVWLPFEQSNASKWQ